MRAGSHRYSRGRPKSGAATSGSWKHSAGVASIGLRTMANSVANEFRRLRGMSAPGSDVGREPGLRIADWPSLNAHRIRRNARSWSTYPVQAPNAMVPIFNEGSPGRSACPCSTCRPRCRPAGWRTRRRHEGLAGEQEGAWGLSCARPAPPVGCCGHRPSRVPLHRDDFECLHPLTGSQSPYDRDGL